MTLPKKLIQLSLSGFKPAVLKKDPSFLKNVGGELLDELDELDGLPMGPPSAAERWAQYGDGPWINFHQGEMPLDLIETLGVRRLLGPKVGVDPPTNIDIYNPDPEVFQYKTYGGPMAGNIEIGGFRRTPMIDIDSPDIAHSSGVTVASKGEGVAALQEMVGRDPRLAQRMYLTRGGVRSFEVGRGETSRSTPERWFDHIEMRLGMDKTDPNYSGMAREGARSEEDAIPDLFNFRTSPKQSRKKDFVALPIGTYVGKKAKISPKSLRNVVQYHDKRIKFHTKGLIEPEDVQEFMAAELPHLPTSIAARIREMYHLGLAMGLGGVAAMTATLEGLNNDRSV